MAKPLVVSIPHNLGKDEAMRRMKDGLHDLKTKHAGGIVTVLEDSWEGDQLTYKVGAMGQNASGTLDVTEDHVTLVVQLPWLLAMVAEKARALIEKESTLLLEKK